MKKCLLFALGFAVAPVLLAQDDATGSLPSDPNALIHLAAPYYDYASPDMRPWHIRYHYQYFDENSQPSAEGEFDYWWSTTRVSRASWTHADQTHGGQSHIEWRTADGKELHSVTGNDIAGMEHRLYFALLPSFLKVKDSLAADRQLKYFMAKYPSQELACVGSVKTSNADTEINSLAAVWPAYCFNEHEPFLVASHENGTITNVYTQIKRFQNHNFPGQMEVAYAGKIRLEAKLEDLSEVRADDPAFTPSADAKVYAPQTTPLIVSTNSITPVVLIQRVNPVYPQSALTAHVSGTVVIEATISKDGKVKDPKVVSSPELSLSQAALDAVSQWRYQPATLSGQPVEIKTHISLNFAPR